MKNLDRQKWFPANLKLGQFIGKIQEGSEIKVPHLTLCSHEMDRCYSVLQGTLFVAEVVWKTVKSFTSNKGF